MDMNMDMNMDIFRDNYTYPDFDLEEFKLKVQDVNIDEKIDNLIEKLKQMEDEYFFMSINNVHIHTLNKYSKDLENVYIELNKYEKLQSLFKRIK